MIRRSVLAGVLSSALLAMPAAAAERAAVADAFKWDLTALFPSEAAWSAEREALAKATGELAGLRGTLGESPKAMAKALETVSGLDRRLARLAVYASMTYDLDQRVARSQEMFQQAQQLRTDFQAAAAWLRPEILALGSDRVRAFVAADPALAAYRHPLDDILRRAPHTLPADAEKLVAQAGTMADAAQTIRDQFVNAEFPYPEVTLSTGETVKLDAASYTKYRASTNRDDRVKVFRAFWNAYGAYAGTLGAALNAQYKAHVFDRDVRHFGSCLEDALFADNIPTRVYSKLLEDVHANLPTLHRYLKLRQRMMGLPSLSYEDLYAPIVGKLERKFTPEEAMKLTLDAVAPLGKAYQDALRGGFENRWVDWFPSTGKRSGAYSTGAYGIHPYQLQNFTGLYEEVSTLAHESGHSMHTYLSDRAQPYATHDYPIFIAEVASTLNENLLFHSMLDRATDDDTRLFLLGSYLDNLRTTLFRQTLFAELELRAHEKVERGEPLTGEGLNKAYLALVREYYGHDRGICAVDDAYGVEWAYIPHFYYDFYVYQYATSVVAAISIADGVRREAAATPASTAKRDAYLAMLSAGSSRYAFDLLKGAGVDMTTSGPFEAAMREMNRIIDAMEAILDRRAKGSR